MRIPLDARILATTICASIIPGIAQAQGNFASNPAHRAPDYVGNRVLVRFDTIASPLEKEATVNAAGVRSIGRVAKLGVEVVVAPPGIDARTVARDLRGKAGVRFAEPDMLVPVAAAPNDPQYPNQWQLGKIQAPSAWDTTAGASSVVVAVIDSGCDPTHPDLVPNYVPGWNFYDNNANTADVRGHGTAVAGCVSAATNNGIGIASTTWNCKVMPVRVSDTNGYAFWSTIASALLWSADRGAKVANVSFKCSESATILTACQYFAGKGGTVAISAGNQATLLNDPDNAYALTCSATDSADNLASFSNSGAIVDLAAPGVSVFTTAMGGGYGWWSGTSFSAPITAGVAALVYSVNPGLTSAQVRDILTQSADDLGAAGKDVKFGWGRVNAARAVALAKGSLPAADTTPPSVVLGAPTTGAILTGSVTATATATDNLGVSKIVFAIDGNAIATDTTAPYSAPIDTTKLANGSHTFTATAYDAAGNLAAASVGATVSNQSDTTAPSVEITSPANGAIVRGTVTVVAKGSDNVGIVRYELFVNNALYATSATPTFSWQARRTLTGSATLLQVKAWDSAGNGGTSAVVKVLVSK